MKLREPDSAKLVAAFGPNIFFDEFCFIHDQYVDDDLHPEIGECDTEDVPTIRCPKCAFRVAAVNVKSHLQIKHGG